MVWKEADPMATYLATTIREPHDAAVVALAEKESGMNLTAFFDAWIYQDAKPTAW